MGHLAACSASHTGQTECWDASGALIACAGTGQDGEQRGGVAWPSPRFTDNGDQTITDSLTGLIWAKDANLMMTRDPSYDNADGVADGKVGWEDAVRYVKKLNAENSLGYNDWRLPNRNELEAMVNKQQPDQATWLNSQGFNNIWADGYWSSSTFHNPAFNYPFYAWFVNMSDGYVMYSGSSTFGVWPVRSGQAGILALPKTGQNACYDTSGNSITCSGTGQDGELQIGAAWPTPRFIVNSDQTVADNLTGLTWSRDARSPGPSACKPAESKSWQGALDYVKCLNTNSYLGFNDWRLPNRNELASLVNQGQLNSATWLTSKGFVNVGYYSALYLYWSSSTYTANTTKAWIVNMDVGDISFLFKTDILSSIYVWPVRGGQTGPPGDTVVPVISSFVVPDTPTSLTVPVTAFTASDNASVTGYCLSETNIAAGCTWKATPQTSYTFPSKGIKTLYAFAKDAALNVSAAASANVFIPFFLNVMISGNGSGSVHSSPMTDISCIKGASDGCTGKFDRINVTLTASPDSTTSVFDGWTDACTTMQKVCGIYMTSDKTAVATFSLATKSKLGLGATTGFDTLQTAYSSAVSTIFALEGLFSGDWLLDNGKDIILTGGYLADYGPTRNGFTILNGKLTIKSGSLRVDGVKVRQ